MKKLLFLSFLFLPFFQMQAQEKISTREMNLINWMEFAEFVPEKITTVLLPTGTLKPHGVVNNGADNTAPEAMAYPAAETWSASPFPSSIGLYQEGQGYPNFDQGQADEYFEKVNTKVSNFIKEIITKWDLAGL